MSDNGFIPGASFLLDQAAPGGVTTPEDMSDEHRMILQTSWDFVQKEIWPDLPKLESKDAEFTCGLMKQAGELGLLGVDVPEAYGGLGLDKVSSAVVTEAMGAAYSFATTHGAHTGIGALPIVFFGTEEQKQKYLPDLASGDGIGAYALTEPGAGSDAMGGCKTRAVLSDDGQHYILSGQKIFISNAAWAKTFITYAKVDGDKFTAFIVEADFPGVSTGPEETKLGIHGSSTRTLIMEDARVPVENVLHEIGKGHQVAFNILNIARWKLGAGTVGGMKGTLLDGVRYAKTREQFGQAIADFGAIKEKIANTAIRLYMNESQIHRTAGLFESILSEIAPDDPEYGRKNADAIREYAVECSITKVYGSEALGYAADECVQIHGGYGYIDEYPAERAYRDARINRIYEGTNEINRLIILGEIMGRAMKGKLDFFGAAGTLAEEMGDPSAQTPQPSDAPLGVQEWMIENCKKAVILTAAAAAQKFQAELTDEQEVVMRISDMIIEVFAMESGLLRARKVIETAGEDAAALHTAMVKAYVDETMPRIEAWGRSALSHVESSEALEGQLAALRRLLRVQPVDLISLKRTVADRVIERDGYPL